MLTASLVGNPLPEHIKVTVFMDGLRVGPARTQLFRVLWRRRFRSPSRRSTATSRLVPPPRYGRATLPLVVRLMVTPAMERSTGRFPWIWAWPSRATFAATAVASLGT